MSQAQFNLPDIQVSKDVIERVQFSVSSRNAGSKVSECLTHVFVSPYSDDPSAVNWQYVSSGVTCLLRKKELSKTGRKMVWTVNMCLYNVTYGVLVWKGTIAPNSCYTAVAENFHVYVMHELNAIVGLLFEEGSQAREFLRSYLQWDAEKVKDERSRGGGGTSSPSQFRKAMISKPCNFQHIQGTQALDECMEIEKIKTDIQAAFFGMASARRGTDALKRPKSGGGKRKKDVGKPRLQLQNVCVPQRSSSRGGHMMVETSKSVDVDMISAPGRSRLASQGSVPVGIGEHIPPAAQLTLYQSQPDLLHDRQHTSASIPQPQSPQYADLHNSTSSNGTASPTTPHVSPVHSRTQGESPKYDKLPLNGKELHSPASMESAPLVQQNGAELPHSPVYDALQSTPTRRAESPDYDTLQNSNTHSTPPGLTNIDHQYKPQMYVDAIVDNEVAGYTAVAGKNGNNGNSLSLEYSPPPRLSPLTFDDFSQSTFFHPTFVTSTTNC